MQWQQQALFVSSHPSGIKATQTFSQPVWPKRQSASDAQLIVFALPTCANFASPKQASAELLQRRAACGRLRQVLGEFIEWVLHAFLLFRSLADWFFAAFLHYVQWQ